MALGELNYSTQLPDFLKKNFPTVSQIVGGSAHTKILESLDMQATAVERGYLDLNTDQFIAMSERYLRLLGGDRVSLDKLPQYGSVPDALVIPTYRSVPTTIDGMTFFVERGGIRTSSIDIDYASVEVMSKGVVEKISNQKYWKQSIWIGSHFKGDGFQRTINYENPETISVHSPFEQNAVVVLPKGERRTDALDVPDAFLNSLPRKLFNLYRGMTPR